MRKSEVYQLRVKDIDFDRSEITVRMGKGGKDRRVPLPAACIEPLLQQINFVKELSNKDRRENVAGVELPNAFSKKYPNAGTSLGWQWIFPSLHISTDPRTLIVRRHHIHPTVFAKHIQKAVKKPGSTKHVTAHVFRHSFATH